MKHNIWTNFNPEIFSVRKDNIAKFFLTLGSRGYFFLIDISRPSRVNEAQSFRREISIRKKNPLEPR